MRDHQIRRRLAATNPDAVQSGRHTSGEGLDTATRSAMEPRFGFNFADVRIHVDNASTAALGANAYTIGNDIYLRDDQSRPDTPAGERLLAHELTHVVQQARYGAPETSTVSHSNDASETEASDNADRVMLGASPNVAASPAPGIAREEAGAEPKEEESLLGRLGLDALQELPFIGKAIAGTKGVAEGMEEGNTAKQAGGLAEALFSPFTLASELGGWEKETGLLGNLGGVAKGAEGMLGMFTSGVDAVEDWQKGNVGGVGYDVGKGVMAGAGMLSEASLLGEGGVASLLTGGGLGEGALLTEGLGAIGTAGAGATALAGGAVLAAGGLGAMAGNYLAKNTEVGEDTVDSIGWIDHLLGDPEHGQSAIVALDDYRQEQWDEGGLGYLKGAGAALGEGAIATAGAVGGLATGALHGIESIGSSIWDLL
jgi:hypothetical protein